MAKKLYQSTKNGSVYRTAASHPNTNMSNKVKIRHKNDAIWTAGSSCQGSYGVSFYGKTSLLFVKPGLKIHHKYYIDSILKHFVKKWYSWPVPWWEFCMSSWFGPLPHCRPPQAFMDEHMTYVTPDSWTPKSPDLAPMDYFVWGWMLSGIKNRNPTTIDSWKRCLKQVFGELPQQFINHGM